MKLKEHLQKMQYHFIQLRLGLEKYDLADMLVCLTHEV